MFATALVAVTTLLNGADAILIEQTEIVENDPTILAECQLDQCDTSKSPDKKKKTVSKNAEKKSCGCEVDPKAVDPAEPTKAAWGPFLDSLLKVDGPDAYSDTKCLLKKQITKNLEC